MANLTLGRSSLDGSRCVSDARKWETTAILIGSMGTSLAQPGDTVYNNVWHATVNGDEILYSYHEGTITELVNLTDLVVSSAVAVQEEGSTVGTRSTLNFIGATVTAADDAGNSRVNVTITGYDTVAEEGSALTKRRTLNFIGADVTAADDAANSRTNVTIGRPTKFGLLVADVAGCVVDYNSGTDATITPGVQISAVHPMSRGLDGGGTNHIFTSDGAAIYGVNPVWPTTIKAGTTTDADKPVVVVGWVEDDWLDSGVEVEAFIIQNVIYPVTIMKGQAVGAVTGTAFSVDNLTLLWGRDPGVSSLSGVANPDGWLADDNAYALVMQITDGTWTAIDLACPAA